VARRGSLWIGLLAALLLAGCGLPPAIAAATPSPSAIRYANPAAMAAREAVKPDPAFDFGQTIQITTGGFHPATLVSECCKPILFKNLTRATVTLVLGHPATSNQIPAGGTYTYKPANMQSITYHAQENPDWHGAIQVNQTFES
jgi:hypothetical protein